MKQKYLRWLKESWDLEWLREELILIQKTKLNLISTLNTSSLPQRDRDKEEIEDLTEKENIIRDYINEIESTETTV